MHAQMTHSEVAFVVGHVAASSTGPEIFEELSINHGLKFLPEHEPGKPYQLLPREVLGKLERVPTLGMERMFVLLCLERSDSQIANVIQQLKTRRPNARIVVYADEAHDSGALAMECVRANQGAGACDFLVRGCHPLGQVREHLFHLLGARDIYGQFQRKPLRQAGSANRVFIATSYDHAAMTDCFNGIYPAIETLGMEPFLSKLEITSGSMLQKIREHIDDSRVLIVNLSQYQMPHPSPNVFFELGYAIGRGLSVVLVRRAGDNAVVPANLTGAQLIQYCSCSDLAMQLYWSMK